MKRKKIFSNAPWESIIGYSRATKVGNQIWITGTTATNDEGKLVGKNDAYKQAVQTFKNIETALNEAGGGIKHIVRTRMYVTDIDADWKEIGRAHQEYLGEVSPATSMVEVSQLIDPDMKVEIEAVAILDEDKKER